jgi:hypothetical protein
MKILAGLFLALLLAGCMNLEAPPPGFAMHCDTCEQVTAWGIAAEYFYCRESGTAWNPLEDQEAKP